MDKSHIGYPCPECGADMLTKADFKVGRRIQFMISVLMFFGLMKPANYETKPGDGESLLRIHTHNGVTTATERAE
jgi:xanthine/uracil permease